jgi:xanthine dehydrogenase accessory factor
MSAPDPFLLATALAWLAEGRGVAMATVIETWGSAPQPVGSQLLIDAAGNFLGSVSGGCVEAEVVAQAADVIANGAPKDLAFGVEDAAAWKVGLAVALITNLATGTWSLAHASGDVGQDLTPALHEAFRCDKSVKLAGIDGELFINVFNPTPRLIVVGAVHIAQQVVPMARALGHEVIVLDPRSAFATQERFGDTRIVREWPDEALPKIGLDARTALIALTHDPKLDDPALISALASDAFYVGALGSRKTHAKRVERLLQAGVPAIDIERIHAPIGLDLGAQGAAEIALSIVAEITAVQRGKGAR